MAENNPANNLSATLREALAQLDDPTLTILGAARAAIDRALARPVDPSRIAERDAAIAEYAREVIATQRTVFNNALGAATTKLDYALGPLAAPAPRPTAIERVGNALIALGWSGGELDLARRYLAARPGAVVGNIDERGFEIEGAFMSRRDLREWGRPPYFTNKAAWHAQFPRLEEARAS